MQRWGGRFTGGTDERVVDFTRSIEVDAALAADDLEGSIAHVRGLGRAGILDGRRGRRRSSRDCAALAVEVEAGEVDWDPALEDVHMNLEAALEARIGPLARKLHTGRSRNDQVATDLRLWTPPGDRPARRRDHRLRAGARRARRARGRGDPAGHDPHPAGPAGPPRPPPPGLRRDVRARPRPARRRAATARTVSPLGSGALAGAGYPLDREATARELGFDGVTANSLDAVSDRDFVVEVLAAVALGDGPPVAPGRGDHLVVEPGVRLRPGRRRLLDRQLDDAEQAEPRPGRARAREGGPDHRGPDGGARHPEGPATGLPARPPGGQAAALRVGRRARGVARRHEPGSSRRSRSTRPGCGRPPTRASRPRPPSPTRSSGAGSPSGAPTTSSARSWPRPRPGRVGLAAVTDDEVAAGPPGRRRRGGGGAGGGRRSRRRGSRPLGGLGRGRARRRGRHRRDGSVAGARGARRRAGAARPG